MRALKLQAEWSKRGRPAIYQQAQRGGRQTWQTVDQAVLSIAHACSCAPLCLLTRTWLGMGSSTSRGTMRKAWLFAVSRVTGWRSASLHGSQHRVSPASRWWRAGASMLAGQAAPAGLGHLSWCLLAISAGSWCMLGLLRWSGSTNRPRDLRLGDLGALFELQRAGSSHRSMWASGTTGLTASSTRFKCCRLAQLSRLQFLYGNRALPDCFSVNCIRGAAYIPPLHWPRAVCSCLCGLNTCTDQHIRWAILQRLIAGRSMKVVPMTRPVKVFRLGRFQAPSALTHPGELPDLFAEVSSKPSPILVWHIQCPCCRGSAPADRFVIGCRF